MTAGLRRTDGLPVVAPSEDRRTRDGPDEQQNGPSGEQDHPDDLQNRDGEQQAHDQQDQAERYQIPSLQRCENTCPEGGTRVGAYQNIPSRIAALLLPERSRRLFVRRSPCLPAAFERRRPWVLWTREKGEPGACGAELPSPAVIASWHQAEKTFSVPVSEV